MVGSETKRVTATNDGFKSVLSALAQVSGRRERQESRESCISSLILLRTKFRGRDGVKPSDATQEKKKGGALSWMS